MNTEIEIWKDIIGYEGLYQVSSFGRVKSLERICEMRYGFTRKVPEKIRSLNPDKDGYLKINLHMNGETNRYMVHRLIALLFIPNTKDAPVVNHINGIKNDNRVDNLEWATISENTKHGFDKLNRIPVAGKNHYSSKVVIQLSKDGFFLNSFETITEAAKQTNTYRAGIVLCIAGKHKHAGGFKWA